MGVLTTQTLLRSVGVCQNRSASGAVAINWILKVLSTAEICSSKFSTIMNKNKRVTGFK